MFVYPNHAHILIDYVDVICLIRDTGVLWYHLSTIGLTELCPIGRTGVVGPWLHSPPQAMGQIHQAPRSL